ncbi:MAG: transposase [Candidatus Omnitrophota bacterium]
MYDHYIAVDWAQRNMAIARMTKEASAVKVINVASSLKELQIYLGHLRGKKILTFEETSTSQWLYVELKDYVDEIVVCDPYRNHLLSDGPKTDELDASKLVRLLKEDFLKPVFHSADEFIYLRKLISGYEDLIKAGVRLKNQRSSLFRSQGKNKNQKNLQQKVESFVLEGVDRGIGAYEDEKTRYEAEMEKQRRKHLMIRNLDGISGIGVIGAVKIAARVVDGRRFEDKGKWLSYCGLVRQEKLSGGRSYGWKKPRYCRTLKGVFKTAAMAVIGGENSFNGYYDFLLGKKHYSEHNARHAVARKIATIAWAVMKIGKPFDPEMMDQGTQN